MCHLGRWPHEPHRRVRCLKNWLNLMLIKELCGCSLPIDSMWRYYDHMYSTWHDRILNTILANQWFWSHFIANVFWTFQLLFYSVDFSLDNSNKLSLSLFVVAFTCHRFRLVLLLLYFITTGVQNFMAGFVRLHYSIDQPCWETCRASEALLTTTPKNACFFTIVMFRVFVAMES